MIRALPETSGWDVLGVTVGAGLGLDGEGHSSGPRLSFTFTAGINFSPPFSNPSLSMGNAAWRKEDKKLGYHSEN